MQKQCSVLCVLNPWSSYSSDECGQVKGIKNRLPIHLFSNVSPGESIRTAGVL